MIDSCANCGNRIVLVNWAMGPGWTHQKAGAAGHDGQHYYCHKTAAEPSDRAAGREATA